MKNRGPCIARSWPSWVIQSYHSPVCVGGLWFQEPAAALSTYYENGLLSVALTLAPVRRQISKGRKAQAADVEARGTLKTLTEFAGGRQMQKQLRLLEPYLFLSLQ